MFDLGDFIDDYATDPALRNDLGMVFVVTVDAAGPERIEAIPIKLGYARTRLATGADRRLIERRFIAACGHFGTPVTRSDGRLRTDLRVSRR